MEADPDLRYSAETDKFYKLVSSDVTFASANAAALGTNLDGIAGQLGTIRSAAEQELFVEFFGELADQFWLGATDSTVEGEWRWQESGVDADQFWQGDCEMATLWTMRITIGSERIPTTAVLVKTI